MGGKQETDLRLADGARARVDRPDVQAPAEERVDVAGEPGSEAILFAVRARPLRGSLVTAPNGDPLHQIGTRGGSELEHPAWRDGVGGERGAHPTGRAGTDVHTSSRSSCHKAPLGQLSTSRWTKPQW